MVWNTYQRIWVIGGRDVEEGPAILVSRGKLFVFKWAWGSESAALCGENQRPYCKFHVKNALPMKCVFKSMLTKGDPECASYSGNFHMDVDVVLEVIHVPARKI